MKRSLGFPPLPRHNISAALQRLIKSMAQLFALQREEDEEVEMEIGFPTDVQHVTHIGCDGSRTIITLHNRDGAPEFLSLPALTLEEFVAGNSDIVAANESPEHVLL
uniref:CRIB domain-containing protein n=1 Tax=Musa acuminata subsp. malaccensis TaxID=214687 RepID=A0A804K1B0_MUSAM